MILKKVLLVGVFLFINQYALAQQDDCKSEVMEVASSVLEKHTITGVEKTDIVLEPGEEKGFYQGEIWNSSESDHAVEVYLVQSYYMSFFKNAFLVNPKTCDVENIIEVFFE